MGTLAAGLRLFGAALTPGPFGVAVGVRSVGVIGEAVPVLRVAGLACPVLLPERDHRGPARRTPHQP
ncbi:hypothetical protein Smic_49030 [Streptomyces microflavus]|uniref:Uncharacterized protein n=1 Tax=Streptomyces microflavus TaxID=1919 RepID=A0A7J0CX65_STRMI|nr:hypothetical protein Smic_49030 [Streptomyces microflavus]